MATPSCDVEDVASHFQSFAINPATSTLAAGGLPTLTIKALDDACGLMFEKHVAKLRNLEIVSAVHMSR